ncbi:MAG: GDP-mannose 4,6-dehydratase [Acidobacteria bacterium]|nr:GDP-mannose 4,6-dehydratase [Acidobacteriota bacterium]MCI0624652.1 GDP-mannose 4,6-dehydratase [Acidobacteriota bacterium]MCI0717818.1 GDP-mannose 4,6-dehydratase [Acidobacteriota bacterium]
MTILLTGGAGFIGSHLAERLITQGHKLILVDEVNDFYSPQIKRRNLAAIKSRGDCEFVEADICDGPRLTEVFERHCPEMIIHLAARAGVRPSLEQPLLYAKVNVQGTLHLLELARKFAVQRFVFASSSSIYGTTSQAPFTEDEANPNPISPYGVTKLAGEKLCYCYARLYSLPTICLRFFTVYGPRQRPDLAIHKFARLIHTGREIPMFGDGSSLRDYTYVDDIVDGTVAALSLKTEFEVLNLGNSHPISLSQMIRLLGERLGKRAKIKVQEFQPGDMPFTHANLNKAKRLLGYAPAVPFEEGLSRFVTWFQNTVA